MSQSALNIKIEWTQTALKSLLAAGSKSTQRKIVSKVDSLLSGDNPEKIGKPLQENLAGLYRITHGRYRIIYQIRRTGKGVGIRIEIIIRILYVGMRRDRSRKDVYIQIAKLLRRLEE